MKIKETQNKINRQKITISQEASDKKSNLHMLKNMGFLAQKRNSFSDPYTLFNLFRLLKTNITLSYIFCEDL